MILTRTIDRSTFATLLRAAAGGWQEHRDELRGLDALLGDGDMGVTAELGGASLVNTVESVETDDIGALLVACGRQLNRVCPSTFGTLLASACAEAGSRVAGRAEIQLAELAAIGEGAIDGIKRTGHAEVGEKTLLDSLVPAVRTFAEAITGGEDEVSAVQVALEAARLGAEATSAMPAKHGRARYRQDGGVGVADAGATAMYRLIESFGLRLIALCESTAMAGSPGRRTADQRVRVQMPGRHPRTR